MRSLLPLVIIIQLLFFVSCKSIIESKKINQENLSEVVNKTTKDHVFQDEDPLIIFEHGTVSITEPSLEKLEKSFTYFDTIENLESKYYFIIMPYSCSDDLANDSLIGIKRALKIHKMFMGRFSKKVTVYIDPKTYKNQQKLIPCNRSGIYIKVLKYEYY